MLILEPALQNQVFLTTEVALSIQLSLQVVKNVLRLSVDSLANLHEILPGSLGCGDELGDWELTLDGCSFLTVFLDFIHDLLNSVQQVNVVIAFMTLDLVQIEALYQI